jgi:diguanylate cyclase (GGDEF)-like protein
LVGPDLASIRIARKLISISSRILTFATLATLIPSIGLGALSFWRYQAMINDNVNHELRMMASDATGEMASWLRERVSEVRALSTAYTVIDGLTAGTAPLSGTVRVGTRELELYLHSVQGKLDPIRELTLSDAAGRIVASSASRPAPVVLPAAWSNTSITEGAILEPPRWDEARATATVTVVVPVLSLHNELLGALSAVLDLGDVNPRLQNIVRATLAELILLSPDGQPLLGTRTAAAALTPIGLPTLHHLRSIPGAPITFIGHHQREVLGIADLPRSLPIIVVAERDRAEVFAAWLDSLEMFLLLVTCLTLLVGAAAYWMGRSIVTPLNGLISAADRIAHGDLSVRLRGAPAGEIGHLTRVFNLMTDRLRRSHAEVQAANRVLHEQNQLLETLAVTDGLTGLCNRKKLDEVLTDQFARFRRNHRPYAVLMLDLDNFKAINDGYGHAVGDEVLVGVAAILKQSVRSIDVVARYGGEEFVVVLVESTLGAALDIAERIRSVVEVPRIRAGDKLISVTVSLGVTNCRDGDSGPEHALTRADHALYEAKRAGRNQVHCAM